MPATVTLHPKVSEALVPVFAKYGVDARENPEACLLSLLHSIDKNQNRKGLWPTLDSAMQDASFRSSIEEARKKLEEAA